MIILQVTIPRQSLQGPSLQGGNLQGVILQGVSLVLKAQLHQKLTLGLEVLEKQWAQEDIRTYFNCK
jgi:hypothetical protein